MIDWYHMGARYGSIAESNDQGSRYALKDYPKNSDAALVFAATNVGTRPTSEQERDFHRGWFSGKIGYNIEETRVLTRLLSIDDLDDLASDLRSLVEEYWNLYCGYQGSDCVTDDE